MRQLSNREIRTIKALAEILIPQNGAFSYGYKDIDIISFLEDFLTRAPFRVRWFLFFNLWIFEYFSWILLLFCDYSEFEKNSVSSEKSLLKNLRFWFSSPGIFSRMKFDYREKIISMMREHRYFIIRGIYLLTSIVLLIAFYSDERVMKEIGYCGNKKDENKFKS